MRLVCVKRRGVCLKVLMFGWEFPPYFAGGVGIVCYELTKELASRGVEIEYVMPYVPDDIHPDFLNLVNATRIVGDEVVRSKSFVNITRVRSLLAAYQTEAEYRETLKRIEGQYIVGGPKNSLGKDNTRKMYGENILEEMDIFAKRVAVMAEKGLFNDFSVIHAHDWTTVPAAAVVKRLTGKPLVIHVHITEINKSAGLGVNKEVYDVERQGFFAADRILTVSQNIKNTLINDYGISAEKIQVVHNGNVAMGPVKHDGADFKGNDKVVSYLGRVTGMKGPENFVEVAGKVLKYCPNTKFVMGGSGDKLQTCIDKAKHLGIYDKFYFHGFYTREDAEFFYDVSDVFILPSLMEPFGVTPLEAMCKDTPTIVTKQSGVSEVIKHAFKVDFWDLDKMASQVIDLLKFPILSLFRHITFQNLLLLV